LKKIMVFFCLLPISWGLWAEVTQRAPAVFIPEIFTVGDPVELRILLENPDEENLFVPETFPELSWIEIVDSKIINQGRRSEIILSFVSFETGTKTLPTIDFGAFQLLEQKVNTKSVLEETGRELTPSLEPLLLPQTESVLALILFSLVALPVGLFFLIRFMIHLFGLLISGIQRRKPLKNVQKELEDLKGKLFGTTTSYFYHHLLDAMKKYLGQAFGFSLGAATSTEMLDSLQGYFPPQDKHLLSDYFLRTDEALFGFGEFADSQRLADLELTLEICQEMDAQKESTAPDTDSNTGSEAASVSAEQKNKQEEET
jgi:hypothetical protein